MSENILERIFDKDEDKKEEKCVQFPLIGNPAPAWTANTTNGIINFPEDYEGKWVILFSHPADFTPVCTTEFMTFSTIQDELRDKYNTELIGLSIDSVHAHLGWIESIKGITWNGIEGPHIDFPIIDDVKMEVANKYGMLQGESDTAAVRAVFFIDPEGTMRTILYYPASLGRNFDEIMRIIAGLQKADEEGVALPANWKPGADVIVPPPTTTAQVNAREKEAEENDWKLEDWYLTFKEDK